VPVRACRCKSCPGHKVKKDFQKLSIKAHKKSRGKLSVQSKMSIKNRNDLSIAYTPGVAGPSLAIARDKNLARSLTLKSNSVAVISDGSAVLGLGNIGPEAALPVMEGKAIIFKEFANIDAYPICLATQDTEEIVETIKNIAVGFGGINLEDISAPRCFEIEERLKRELSIPVMHDDQHGTAIVVLAGLLNALKVTQKKKERAKVVVNGAGAAGIAIAKLLHRYGFRNILLCDSKGIVSRSRKDLSGIKKKMLKITNKNNVSGTLEDALEDSDIFIGVSVAGALKAHWVESMADNPVVIAMANPNPEISIKDIRGTKTKVFGSGRSDWPNQINNALVFPGLFRGVLDAGASAITDEMKIGAAEAIARLVKNPRADKIIPDIFDKRVVPTIARAISKIVR
jgi:malate dehydrogenase (oxaloacetate-decarboxylating)